MLVQLLLKSRLSSFVGFLLRLITQRSAAIPYLNASLTVLGSITTRGEGIFLFFSLELQDYK